MLFSSNKKAITMKIVVASVVFCCGLFSSQALACDPDVCTLNATPHIIDPNCTCVGNVCRGESLEAWDWYCPVDFDCEDPPYIYCKAGFVPVIKQYAVMYACRGPCIFPDDCTLRYPVPFYALFAECECWDTP